MFQFLHQQANLLGILGVILILIAYTLLQVGKMSAASVSYSLLNALGAALILISLYFYWNLASGVIEIAWLIISVYGLLMAIRRYYRVRRHK